MLFSRHMASLEQFTIGGLRGLLLYLWSTSPSNTRRLFPRTDGGHVPVAEGLGEAYLHKHGVAVGQVQDKEVDPSLHTPYDGPRLTEVALGGARRMPSSTNISRDRRRCSRT